MRTRKLEAIALVAALALAGAPWSACAQNRTLGLKGIGIELRCRIDDDCESRCPAGDEDVRSHRDLRADLDIFPAGRWRCAWTSDMPSARRHQEGQRRLSEIKNRVQFSAGGIPP
jgi:hypothetical protein